MVNRILLLDGTVKGTRRRGRQPKRWEDNIKDCTGLDSVRAVEDKVCWGDALLSPHLWCPATTNVQEMKMKMKVVLLWSFG